MMVLSHYTNNSRNAHDIFIRDMYSSLCESLKMARSISIDNSFLMRAWYNKGNRLIMEANKIELADDRRYGWVYLLDVRLRSSLTE